MSKFPRVDSRQEENRAAWKPRRCTLILKMLGKNVGFKVLDQKMKKVWMLEKGCEITELERGFFLVRFKSKRGYHKVLDEGPWTIQGHYVTVSK